MRASVVRVYVCVWHANGSATSYPIHNLYAQKLDKCMWQTNNSIDAVYKCKNKHKTSKVNEINTLSITAVGQ